MNNNINMIKGKKINELKENEIKQNDLIKKYEEYIEKTIAIFKNLLNKINSINNCLNLEKNNKLNNLINAYSLSLKNLSIDEISNVINEELDKFILHFKNGNDNNNINNGEEIIKKNKQAMEKINDIFGFITTLNNTKINIQNYLNDVEKLIKVKDIEKKKDNEINNNNSKNNKNNSNKINSVNNNKNNNNNENKNKINEQIKEQPKESKINTTFNKINLIYFVKSEGNYIIFGNDFVENNKNNIELIVNEEEKFLVSRYKLKKRENIISIIIKKNLTNLSKMF